MIHSFCISTSLATCSSLMDKRHASYHIVLVTGCDDARQPIQHALCAPDHDDSCGPSNGRSAPNVEGQGAIVRRKSEDRRILQVRETACE